MKSARWDLPLEANFAPDICTPERSLGSGKPQAAADIPANINATLIYTGCLRAARMI